MVRRHLVEAEFQFLNRRFRDNGAVLGLVDEGFGILDSALLDQIGPELLGHVKLGVNLYRLFDRNNLFVHRCVVQLTVCLVPGTCVVEHPGIPGPGAVQSFQNGDIQFRCQLFRQGGESGAHYSCADNDYVH